MEKGSGVVYEYGSSSGSKFNEIFMLCSNCIILLDSLGCVLFRTLV